MWPLLHLQRWSAHTHPLQHSTFFSSRMRASVELAGQQLVGEAEHLRLLAQPHLRRWAIWAQRYSSQAMQALAAQQAQEPQLPRARHRKYMVELAALGLQQVAILALPAVMYPHSRQRPLAFHLAGRPDCLLALAAQAFRGLLSSRLSIMAGLAEVLAAMETVRREAMEQFLAPAEAEEEEAV